MRRIGKTPSRWTAAGSGDHAAEGEPQPPDPAVEVAEFAEHRLTPLAALRGSPGHGYPDAQQAHHENK
jgi:hypothetical protein